MVIDTSALLAVLLGEPEAAAVASALANQPTCLISAVTELETAIETCKGAGFLDLWAHLVVGAANGAPTRWPGFAYGGAAG